MILVVGEEIYDGSCDLSGFHIYDSCLYKIVIVMHTILKRLQTLFFFPKIGPKFQFNTC